MSQETQKIEIVNDRRSGLGTASMVLGIIAIIGCWIPFLNIFSIILGFIGLFLGIPAFITLLVKKKGATGKIVAGLILCSLTLFIAFSMNGAATTAINESIDELGGNKTKYNLSETSKQQNNEEKLTEEELIAELEKAEMSVISTKYEIQDERYKSLYPDMLQAVIKNNTSYDIKNAVVAFVAWDKNNLPVKIKGAIDFSDGSYIREVNYSDINLIPNDTYGKDSGFEIDENSGISKFKAIVVSYETFEGEIWYNPYYDEWCEFYEGVKLK